MNTLTHKKEGPPAQERQVRDQERYLSPEVDIYETREEYLMQAEMPGVNKDGLELTLEGHVLTITGHRREQVPQGTALYRESNGLDYRRVFELDPAIDTGRINARMDHGMLTLRLPKSEQVRPRKINVTE